MGRLKKVFQHYADPKNISLGPQKVKNDPKIKSKSKVRIEGTIEKIFSSTSVDGELLLNPTPNPKIAN